jgi:hypothetical protein
MNKMVSDATSEEGRLIKSTLLLLLCLMQLIKI